MIYLLRSFERNWVFIILSLAALIAALATGLPIFFTLTYLFGGVLLVSFAWAWLNLHWVRLSREMPQRYVQVGHSLTERLVVKNTGPLPKLWLEIKDYSDLPHHRPSRVISRVGAGQQRSWQTRTPCYRRGRYTVGPLSIISGDPFGLFLLKKNLPRNFTSHVVVFPLAVDLPGFQPPVGELTGGDITHQRTHYTTTNVMGIREYTFGDSIKRVHWPSTARQGRLMVKEFELDPMADIWLFLDMAESAHVGPRFDQIRLPKLPEVHWQPLPPFKLAPSTTEYGVTIAASLSRHFLRQGRSVGLITYPRGQRRTIAQTDRGERQLTRIYELLAMVQAQGEIPMANLLTMEGMRLTRSTTAIIVTSANETRWVSAVRHLTDRGIRTMAVFVEPHSFGHEAESSAVEVELIANRIPYYIVKQGDEISQALSKYQ